MILMLHIYSINFIFITFSHSSQGHSSEDLSRLFWLPRLYPEHKHPAQGTCGGRGPAEVGTLAPVAYTHLVLVPTVPPQGLVVHGCSPYLSLPAALCFQHRFGSCTSPSHLNLPLQTIPHILAPTLSLGLSQTPDASTTTASLGLNSSNHLTYLK